MNKYAKWPIVYWFAFLFLLSSILAPVLLSCGRKPMPGENNKEIRNDSLFVQNDSSQVIDRNMAVIDSLKTVIGAVQTGRKDCDSICQATVDRLLSQINTQKTSGNNSYGFYYDAYKKTLVAYAKLAETINKTTNVAKARHQTTTVYKTTTRTVPVPYTPAYMKYSAWFGWAAAAFFIIRAYLKRSLWLPKSSTT